jgi:hypothetical protein
MAKIIQTSRSGLSQFFAGSTPTLPLVRGRRRELPDKS